jgi:GMP synthase-like glutamine amidotransferase
MHVLIVQNFESTGLGQVCEALEEAGASRDYRKPYLGEALPEDCSAHDAIVVLGGAQNAIDDENHPYLPKLAALMRCFADNDKAALGICLGSQILARAFGATNLLDKATEFGWCQVDLTDAAKSDPVLSAVPQSFPIFQWHNDTFTLPDGAVRLAQNAVTPNQAFRVGRAAYGMQFHFEADQILVEKWNDRFADYLDEHKPFWKDAHASEAAKHGPQSDAAGRAIAKAWVAQIRPMSKAA